VRQVGYLQRLTLEKRSADCFI